MSIETSSQGWRVLDGTQFLPWYLSVNTVLGKTGFGLSKWEKLEKHNFTYETISYINNKTQHDLEMHSYRT